MRQGLIQVYIGEGKGKTSAAVGLMVRALGQRQRVLLVRLLKPREPASGEVLALEGFENAELLTAGVGVIHGQPDPQQVRASVQQVFLKARAKIVSGGVDLVVFDEANGALNRGALDLEQVLELIGERPAHVELVFTGRNAPPELLDVADLVTEMKLHKHPFQQGVAARRGIEY